MMNRSFLHRALYALGVIVLLGGCSNLTKSPAQGLTFTAPAGFSSKASMLGVMQVWTTADNNQVLMLVRLPATVNFNDAFKSANMQDTKILAKRDITICGNLPATYMELTGTRIQGNNRHDDRADVVFLKGTADTMLSLYAYPPAQKPDAAAQSALRELCARPGASS